MRRVIQTFAICITSATLPAQDFDFSADLEPVNTDGYHAIAISPDLLSKSGQGLRDLRIEDESEQRVPYVIRVDEAISYTGRFIPFTIIKKTIHPNKYTEIIIEQESGSSLDEIHIEVANAAVTKSVEITGSDDLDQWYAVRSNHVGLRPRNDGKTSTLSVVDLPLSAHRYFRITIADSLSPPLKILDLGHQGREKRLGRFDEASGYEIITTHNEDLTELLICSEHELLIDRMRFSTDTSEQFHRLVNIYNYSTHRLSRRQRRSKVQISPRKHLQNGYITSGEENVFPMGGIRADTILIEIQNGDNKGLETLDIHIENRRRNAIAKLSKGKIYTLKTGNKEVRSPHYDLHRFVNKETVLVSELDHGAVNDHREDQAGPLKGLSRNWMWIVIGLITLFMLYMVSGMIKDHKQEENA